MIDPGVDFASFTITNNTGGTIILSEIALEWPMDMGELKKVDFISINIAAGNLGFTPATVVLGADPIKRSLEDGQMGLIEFTFDEAAVATGYTLAVQFDTGCIITASQ